MVGNKMLSIKRFSKLTGIKQSTLRYFDDLGLFTPTLRGDNGYRYYSPQQIITINSIRLLSELNMPTKTITAVERNRTPEYVMHVLEKKEAELATELNRLQRSYDIIRTLRGMIQSGISSDETRITIQSMDALPIVIGFLNDFGTSEYFYDTFLRFCDEAENLKVDLRLPVGGLFTDFKTFRATPSQPQHFFSVDPAGGDRKEAGRYIVAFGRGYYGEMGNVPDRMESFAREQGIEMGGPLYVIYLLDELSVVDRNNYLFQISCKVCEGG